ncbi:MAG: hypothetical protein IJW92_01600 [Clostridia bacterium]|nr:hypothetical protein [Clostridia bacterium]
MKTWNLFKKWLIGGCVAYSLLSLFVLLLQIMISESTLMVDANSFLLMFPCGLGISAAIRLGKTEKLPRWVRYILQYVIILLSFVLFLWLPRSTAFSPVNLLLLLVLLSVIYWVLFLLIHLLLVRIKRLWEED